jgi:DNA-binding MarR family transcriptional regulator
MTDSHAQAKDSAQPNVFDNRGRTIAWMARTVHRMYDVLAQRVLDREGISIAHWYYLRVLAERGDLNQLELSKRVGIASTTAVPALSSLEKRGLVKRSRAPLDRRKYVVSLTEKGRSLLVSLMPEIFNALQSSLAGVTLEEMNVLWMVLYQIDDNLTAMAGSEAVLD